MNDNELPPVLQNEVQYQEQQIEMLLNEKRHLEVLLQQERQK